MFQQVTIKDPEIREACLNHHNGEESKNELLPLVQYFDRLAACISRKKPFREKYRYDKRQGAIDFAKLVKEIEQRQHSAYKLYNYIYHSKELARIVEALTFSKGSLRRHILIMVNLAVNKFYEENLTSAKENERKTMLKMLRCINSKHEKKT